MLPLTHSPADVLAQALIDLDLVTDPDTRPLDDWPCYVSAEPWFPDNTVTLFDTQGQDYGREAKTRRRMERAGIQVRLRGRTYPMAQAKALAICRGLDHDLVKQEVLLGGVHYLIWAFSRTGAPIPLDNSTSACTILTINGTVTLKKYP